MSPEQSPARFADKIEFYLLNGVRLVWVIDPEERTVLRLLASGQSAGEVAQRFGLSRESVRLIQKRAVDRLRQGAGGGVE